MTPQDIQSRILFQDQLMIVLNKPHGIPVHGGASGGESLEDYFSYLQFGYKEMPRLAHRLDRDTSGCLIIGRNDRALRKLGRLFETGRIEKTYWAITDKPPPAPQGVIDTPLAKIKLHKGWSMQPAAKGSEGAQEAVTEYKILQTLQDGGTLIELHPRTGRTHQIRVHLQSLGCPIRGDWLYGPLANRPETGHFPTLHLHARSVLIPLYDDAPPVSITAPPPRHIEELIS